MTKRERAHYRVETEGPVRKGTVGIYAIAETETGRIVGHCRGRRAAEWTAWLMESAYERGYKRGLHEAPEGYTLQNDEGNGLEGELDAVFAGRETLDEMATRIGYRILGVEGETE